MLGVLVCAIMHTLRVITENRVLLCTTLSGATSLCSLQRRWPPQPSPPRQRGETAQSQFHEALFLLVKSLHYNRYDHLRALMMYGCLLVCGQSHNSF